MKDKEVKPLHVSRKPFGRMVGRAKEIGGICAGVAYTFACPVLLVRIAMFASIFVSASAAFWVYIVFWVCAPKWEVVPDDYDERTR